MWNVIKDGHLDAVRTTDTLSSNTTAFTEICLFFRPVLGQITHAVNSAAHDQPDMIRAADVGRKWFSQMCQILVMELLSHGVTFGKYKMTCATKRSIIMKKTCSSLMLTSCYGSEYRYIAPPSKGVRKTWKIKTDIIVDDHLQSRTSHILVLLSSAAVCAYTFFVLEWNGARWVTRDISLRGRTCFLNECMSGSVRRGNRNCVTTACENITLEILPMWETPLLTLQV